MGGARGRRARQGTAAVAGRRGERSAGGFSPRYARLAAEGPRLLLALFLPWASGDVETGGKGENPAPLPRGNRVALKAAKRRGLESGSEAAGSRPHRGESEPEPAGSGGRSRSRYWLKVAELLLTPLSSEAPRGVSKLPGAWGALKGSRGIPQAQDWAPQRGKRRRLGGPGRGCVEHRCCFSGERLPCCLARQLQIRFRSCCRGESMWVWGCKAQ